MEIPILTDILIIFSLSVVVIYLCNQVKIPVIVGFLFTGILVGPKGLGLIHAVHEVEILSEIGVILLLFTIGIEFSLSDLLKIKRSVLLGGSLQVGLSILVTWILCFGAGLAWNVSVFIGFLISLSSTAIVLQLLQQRSEIESPHGRNALAILIFQDIIVVLMMLVTPMLAGKSNNITQEISFLILKTGFVIAFVIVGARYIVPFILYRVTLIRSHQLFLVTVITICIAITWMTNWLGLSPALGAFLAGLIISESEYSHQALGEVHSFRDIFTSFFFISVGMLLDVHFFANNILINILLAFSVVTIKLLVVMIAILLLGYPLRIAILVGFSLCQIGEFSFILSKYGIQNGLLSETITTYFLSVSILTMAATPFLIMVSQTIADIIQKRPLPKTLKSGLFPSLLPSLESSQTKPQNHLIIVGFGVNGRNVAHAARISDIPYQIIEMNPITVRTERTNGEPIVYGDSTHESILHHVNIEQARVLVVAVSDASSTRRTVELARRMNPSLRIIIRTRFVSEIKSLQNLGADEVIPEEFETAVEIFTRVLRTYMVPVEEIDQIVSKVRLDNYEVFRKPRIPAFFENHKHVHLSDLEIHAYCVQPYSPADGKTLAELQLRSEYETTIVTIVRGGTTIHNPGGDDYLHANDIVYVLGKLQSVRKINRLLMVSRIK
jgi:CPA2 family monovalent cation:H+ antiporter-2